MVHDLSLPVEFITKNIDGNVIQMNRLIWRITFVLKRMVSKCEQRNFEFFSRFSYLKRNFFFTDFCRYFGCVLCIFQRMQFYYLVFTSLNNINKISITTQFFNLNVWFSMFCILHKCYSILNLFIYIIPKFQITSLEILFLFCYVFFLETFEISLSSYSHSTMHNFSNSIFLLLHHHHQHHIWTISLIHLIQKLEHSFFNFSFCWHFQACFCF
jgi:hypothetical protein